MRSASIIANGASFENALGLIKKNSDIGIGIHLCLIGERPLLSKGKVRSLVDNNGFFPKDYRHLMLKIWKKKIIFLEVEHELETQIKKVLDCGISPTHLDSHQYTHLISPIFAIILALAKKYHIKWIRYPRKDKFPLTLSFTNLIKKIYLNFFSSKQIVELNKNHLGFADLSCGIFSNGHLTREILENFLNSLPTGLCDVTCHPGYIPKNTEYHNWGYRWEQELDILKNQAIKDSIKRLNIKLVNYAR